MARVTAVHRPANYPGTPDEATKKELDEMFGSLFPGVSDPQIDASHDGLAIAALSPKLALQLARTSGFIAVELPWCARADLRELAIQTVHAHFDCDYAFRARMKTANACGISIDQQEALRDGKDRDVFDAEQRLVVDYSRAVAGNSVTDDLSARAVARFGERGTVELTTVAAFWSFWAMFLNATRPDDA
jgi:alkylhydroperoxidase family enzyme